MPPRCRSVHLALVACLSPIAPALGQEIGAGYVVAESDHAELEGATGGAVQVLLEMNADWYVDMSLQRVEAGVRREGLVCVNYTPRVGCRAEETVNNATLTGFRAGVMRGVDLGDRFRAGAGLGLSFNQVDAESTGVSGLQGDLLEPTGGQIGAMGFLSAAVLPLPGVPARVTGKLTTHWVNFDACSGEEPRRYDPFCSPGTFHELQLGVSFVFRR